VATVIPFDVKYPLGDGYSWIFLYKKFFSDLELTQIEREDHDLKWKQEFSFFNGFIPTNHIGCVQMKDASITEALVSSKVLRLRGGAGEG